MRRIVTVCEPARAWSEHHAGQKSGAFGSRGPGGDYRRNDGTGGEKQERPDLTFRQRLERSRCNLGHNILPDIFSTPAFIPKFVCIYSLFRRFHRGSKIGIPGKRRRYGRGKARHFGKGSIRRAVMRLPASRSRSLHARPVRERSRYREWSLRSWCARMAGLSSRRRWGYRLGSCRMKSTPDRFSTGGGRYVDPCDGWDHGSASQSHVSGHRGPDAIGGGRKRRHTERDGRYDPERCPGFRRGHIPG